MYLDLKEEKYLKKIIRKLSFSQPLKNAIVLLGLLKYKTTHFSEKCLTIIKHLQKRNRRFEQIE